MTKTHPFDTTFFERHTETALEFYAARKRDDMATLFRDNLAHLESPIEAVFAAWWMVLDVENLGLRPQKDVLARGSVYRLDFAIEPIGWGDFGLLLGEAYCPKIAVELDGHDFHERTKEQVTYRNRRDRDLQADGWMVLHVSGSELNTDPRAVVNEIVERVQGIFATAKRNSA